MDFIIPFIAGVVVAIVIFLIKKRDTGSRSMPNQSRGGYSDSNTSDSNPNVN